MQQIIIFLTKSRIFGRSINSNGKNKDISINGNTSIECKEKSNIDEFIECLLAEFRVSNFAKGDFDIIILNCNASVELVRYLYEKCSNINKLNVICIEKVLPLIILNKVRLWPGLKVTIKFMDDVYHVCCDDNFFINPFQDNKETTGGNETVELQVDDFCYLYNLNVLRLLSQTSKHEIGIGHDFSKVIERYCKVAEQGLASIQFNLGTCYKTGHGVEVDLKKAVEWYRKAAVLGLDTAQCNLGICYEYGQGVEIDLEKAVGWYRKAAEQGYAQAQNNLGACYDQGQGVKKDYKKAVKWFRKAAEQDYAIAKYNLGLCYNYGTGVKEDLEKAVEWYRKAAEQGYAPAQYTLGVCYENGKGVEANKFEAVRWYSMAASQGNEEAKEALERPEWKQQYVVPVSPLSPYGYVIKPQPVLKKETFEG